VLLRPRDGRRLTKQPLPLHRIQVDEIWSFTYAKQKNVKTAKAAPEGAGDTWTWTAIDADTKLVMSWLVGGRDSEYAMAFMDDLSRRLANRVQLTSDGHKVHLEAVEGAFGGDID
jgi:IS1 family transposase